MVRFGNELFGKIEEMPFCLENTGFVALSEIWKSPKMMFPNPLKFPQIRFWGVFLGKRLDVPPKEVLQGCARKISKVDVRSGLLGSVRECVGLMMLYSLRMLICCKLVMRLWRSGAMCYWMGWTSGNISEKEFLSRQLEKDNAEIATLRKDSHDFQTVKQVLGVRNVEQIVLHGE